MEGSIVITTLEALAEIHLLFTLPKGTLTPEEWGKVERFKRIIRAMFFQEQLSGEYLALYKELADISAKYAI